MKIIAVGALKGGTGKTAFTLNLGGTLASMGHKVLLIDDDPQSNLSSEVGIDISQTDQLSIKDLYEDADSFAPEDLIVESVMDQIPNLDIIPSSIYLIEAESRLVNRSARESILSFYIKNDHKEFFEQYDYILIDTNPSMGYCNQNAFMVADDIILVTDISYNGLTGVELFQFLWEKHCKELRIKKNISALIVNNFDRRLTLSTELIEKIKSEEHLRDLLCSVQIPTSSKIKDSSFMHTPVCIIDKNGRAATAFRDVIEELKEKGVL